MKKILGVLAALVVVAVVGVVGVFALAGSGTNEDSNPVTLAANDAKNAATNAAINATGIKDKVQSALVANRDSIAAATGLTTDQVDAAVNDLDVANWEAATLPAGAVATGTIDGNYAGVDGTITTYDDPGYVTVEAYGQNITLSVPESAQDYLPFLNYLQ